MTLPVVELVDLGKVYRGGKNGVQAVKGVSISVGAGEVYGFLGPNGAGKSTTIRMLLGLIAPTAGEVHLFGEPLRNNPAVLRRVGSLVDGGAFYPFLSGRTNLQVLAKTHGAGADRIDALLAQVGLSDAANRKVKGYSTGMRQRLGVAAALLGDPELVILDEPVNGLDAAGIQEMRLLIRSLSADHGKTVFLSSHLLHEVQQVCDRVAIISRGEVIREATIRDLLSADEGLRLHASPLELARSVIEERWAATAEGDSLLVSATQEEAPELVRRLVGAGVDIFALAPERRNLEEVFLSITQEEMADV
ncbi:ABC transporter ATP-binding protein [Sphingosinicella sp. BN140058]|uniref:ABC transporter ATP-binding protein n=1 Tax=Sphingosinicella sp. BN140058 TaxID=1892855 RepID=UPI001013ADFF|nr:ABC transporter ATP-binding protein [Sphingosinicella sp. BN140058]QAY75749.1 ABC transporter ATP-binding protein [Sphingosinicella sp. BN140058]